MSSRVKFNIKNIGGEIVKNNETYVLRDNKFLNNLVVSSTELKAGMSTRGHSHAGQEEVYYFVSGSGRMELGDELLDVKENDVVLIPDGAFHRVHNPHDKPLYFVCVFDGKRNH